MFAGIPEFYFCAPFCFQHQRRLICVMSVLKVTVVSAHTSYRLKQIISSPAVHCLMHLRLINGCCCLLTSETRILDDGLADFWGDKLSQIHKDLYKMSICTYFLSISQDALLSMQLAVKCSFRCAGIGQWHHSRGGREWDHRPNRKCLAKPLAGSITWRLKQLLGIHQPGSEDCHNQVEPWAHAKHAVVVLRKFQGWLPRPIWGSNLWKIKPKAVFLGYSIHIKTRGTAGHLRQLNWRHASCGSFSHWMS